VKEAHIVTDDDKNKALNAIYEKEEKKEEIKKLESLNEIIVDDDSFNDLDESEPEAIEIKGERQKFNQVVNL
jgi:hypothetical protein